MKDFNDMLSGSDFLAGLETGQSPDQVLELATGDLTVEPTPAEPAPAEGDFGVDLPANTDPDVNVLNSEEEIQQAETDIDEGQAGIESEIANLHRMQRDLDYLGNIEASLLSAIDRGGMSSGEADITMNSLNRVMEDHDIELNEDTPGLESFQGAMGRISATEAGLESVREGISKLAGKAKDTARKVGMAIVRQYQLVRATNGELAKSITRHRNRIQALKEITQRELNSAGVVAGLAFKSKTLTMDDIEAGARNSVKVANALGKYSDSLLQAAGQAAKVSDLGEAERILRKALVPPASIFVRSGENSFSLRDDLPGGRNVVGTAKSVEVTSARDLATLGNSLKFESRVTKPDVESKFQSLSREDALKVIRFAGELNEVINDVQSTSIRNYQKLDDLAPSPKADGEGEDNQVADICFDGVADIISNEPNLRILRSITGQLTAMLRLLRTVK